MSKGKHAAERMKAGWNCTQSVLGEFADGLGLDLDLADRVACGFGGGMGGTAGACGAVTGGIMVIGLVICDPASGKSPSMQHIDGSVQAFMRQFEKKHGSTLCRDLLGCDLSTPEGLAEAQERGLFAERCPKLVEYVVDLLQQTFPDELS